MSVIDTKHTSVVYESRGKNKTVAFAGQRLVVTIAKADKAGNYGQNLQQTMATSVPLLELSEDDWNSERVQAACTEYFRSVQNEVISARIKETGTHSHSDDEISVRACLEFLDAESSGDKWDAQRIAGWFTSNLADYIGVALLDKNPDIEEEKMRDMLEANCKFVSDTLGSKARITIGVAQKLMDRLVLIPEDKRDGVARRFIARVDAIMNPKLVESLDLGF